MHYLLSYQLAENYLERRAEFRTAHLALAWQAAEQGDLILGGAVGEPVESALLLFEVDDVSKVEHFAQADPYVVNGLVLSYRILPWHTVAGAQANTPLR